MLHSLDKASFQSKAISHLEAETLGSIHALIKEENKEK